MPRLGTLHRWFAFVAGIQLLLWTVSGLIFTLDPIAVVRGEDTLPVPVPVPLDPERVRVTVPEACQAARASGRLEEPIRGVSLGLDRDRLTLAVLGAQDRTVLVDAETGVVLDPLTPVEAGELVQRRYRAETPPAVVDSQLIEDEAPFEFRGGRLPVLRVDLDDGRDTHVYVDPETGRILKRRNATWRRFDFFWMLHIMDYSEREDFSTPWLKIFAGLGVLTALSGLGMVVIHVRRRWRRWRYRNASPISIVTD